MDLLFIGSSTTAVQALLGADVVDTALGGGDLVTVGLPLRQGGNLVFRLRPIKEVALIHWEALAKSLPACNITCCGADRFRCR
jgi:hypothetical protein